MILTPIYVETALLGMGLPSISDQQIRDGWKTRLIDADIYLVWMETGKVMLGDLSCFLSVKNRPEMQRIDGNKLKSAQENQISGFLTASAVMRISNECGAITVTAGMGGIRGAYKSDDLHCLINLPVVLIASAPKDVLGLSASLQYLIQSGTRVAGWQTSQCDGFLFEHPPVEVPILNRLTDADVNKQNSGSLILNPIPARDRLQDENMLQEALKEGVAAEERGESFHPAVNAALDRLSNGVSSMIQLRALVQNINLALKIREKMTLTKDDEVNDSAR
ncbi:MAG: hypothetical protein GXY34_09250 [Syntrophomonadaceae bacterium]|nr:hypothetical protein [Syntrophomonadaceae bacterium]